jgi:hypothetical protein
MAPLKPIGESGGAVVKPEEVEIDERPSPAEQKTVVTSGVVRSKPERMVEKLSLRSARDGFFVRMPTYQKNEKTGRMEEINVPDDRYYMAVGYDRTPGDGIMHYRYVVKDELEHTEYIDHSPFMKYDLLKG